MLPINTQRLNEKLIRSYQAPWYDLCYRKVLAGKEGEISCPFSVGVSKEYVSSEKTVMIFGQEANSLTCDYEKWNLENMQAWAVAYLERQLGIETDYKIDGKRLKYNGSPFWDFFRAMKKSGYFPCWNDLDKVKRYKAGNEYRLKLDEEGYGQRKILNAKVKRAKSLLQNEIELLKPDIVVFAIGPRNPYFSTLGYAFDLDEAVLSPHCPTPEKPCREISKILGLDMPAYWTYHPNYLSRKGIFGKVLNEITEQAQT